MISWLVHWRLLSNVPKGVLPKMRNPKILRWFIIIIIIIIVIVIVFQIMTPTSHHESCIIIVLLKRHSKQNYSFCWHFLIQSLILWISRSPSEETPSPRNRNPRSLRMSTECTWCSSECNGKHWEFSHKKGRTWRTIGSSQLVTWQPYFYLSCMQDNLRKNGDLLTTVYVYIYNWPVNKWDDPLSRRGIPWGEKEEMRRTIEHGEYISNNDDRWGYKINHNWEVMIIGWGTCRWDIN